MTAAPAEKRAVIIERDIAHPPEKLWRALTQPHLLEEWLMTNDFKPELGHRFNLRNEPQPGVNVVVDCEVLEVEPHEKLSYTWDAFGLESTVIFTLTPTPAGTRLRVEQSGFRPDQQQAFKGARAGWHMFLARLDQVLARTE